MSNNDLISRKALKAELLGRIALPDWVREAVLHIIDNAPTVEPTFGVFREMLCSECEKIGGNNTFRYCPNCGADMRVKDELNELINELKEGA